MPSHWVGADGKRTGSIAGWRRVRELVLNRDRWVCQLCLTPIDPALPKEHPLAAQVHHLVPFRTLDPRYLVAAHRDCNTRAGDPGRQDPQPRSATRW